jgi:hypothetical protein
MFSATSFWTLLRLASTSSGDCLYHVSSKNAGAAKLCALLHKIENRIFSLTADDGQAAQVDYQFASFQVVARVSPGGAKLVNPGITELSLHYQPALRSGVGDGNLEHWDSVLNQVSATGMPKLQGRKVLKSFTYQNRRGIVSTNVKTKFDTCRTERG